MSERRAVVAGGGAAGFFGAIRCAEAGRERGVEVLVLEKSPRFLSKVKISGGGRCNVTHACFDARELTTRYPRGERALIAPFMRFQAKDTVAWFEERGVKLKVEQDGRMFPVTDDSQTVIDCLLGEARRVGVQAMANQEVLETKRRAGGGFDLMLRDGKELSCDCLLLATGGCRAAAGGALAVSLGHRLEPLAPSLFTFHIESAWLRSLAGISVEPVEATVVGEGLTEKGPVLVTHWGLSGPAVLRLSAWGARVMQALDYRFPLHLNWLPGRSLEAIAGELEERRAAHPARLVINSPLAPLPGRLWEQLVMASGVARDTRWAELSRKGRHDLVQQLTRTELMVTGKSLNKDEFVTCGGVRLGEVNLKTMESRLTPGLYFAGELLDIDGITGGFNFQAAWTTGWIAGDAMARALRE